MKSQSPVSVHSSLSGWLAGFCFISWVTLLSVGCATPHPIDSPKFDTDGMVFTGNQRSFILGLYQPTNGTGSFRELSETGYNLLNLPADTRLLDSAQKYGLKAWVTTGTLDTLKLEKSWKSIQKVVLSLKNHPALLAWEIADEPAYTWNSSQLRIVPKLMIATHDSISTLDPTHLIYLNHAPVNLVQTMQ
ncbi:MAG: hypothetical protein LWW85_08700, partial [Marinilabiliales bacterium]|nr:hypothetical protein [Marinilabiliales bacterium]